MDYPSSRSRFPVPNPTVSFWLSNPSDLAHYKSLPTPPEHVDIAIIGSGLAGVSAAYYILKRFERREHKPRVAIFEARTACSGATGRNGGHTKILPSTLKTLQERWGDEIAAAMGRTAIEQRQLLQEIIERESIKCDFFRTRSFDIYFDNTEAEELREWLAAQRNADGPLREVVQDMQFLDGPNIERITGVKGVKGAISSPAASLWPYKLVIGLLTRVLELGGEFYADTPILEVTSLEDGSDEAASRLHFDPTVSKGGQVPETKAKHVIFATNGYTSALLSGYSLAITPVRGTASHLVVADSRRSESSAPPFLSHTYNLHYSPASVDYLVPRPDGAIILGGARRTFEHDRSKYWDNVDDAHVIEEARSHFDTRMQVVYHQWEDSGAKVERLWTGVMGYTADGMPHVGPVPGKRNLWIAAGFNGGGMTLILTSTKALVKMVLSEAKRWEDLNLPAPFEPTERRLHPENNVFT